MYNKLHYISHGDTLRKQLYNIHFALENGCDWIQLKYKDADPNELFKLAETVRLLCDEYLATLIIHEDVHIAQRLDADGVHLGLTGMSAAEARKLLGNDKIIGATTNTFEDVLQRIKENCDYIGLGPLRETGKNSKPILGIERYASIIEKMQAKNLTTPLYAVGGIQLEDIDELMSIGVYGVAVSKLITDQPEIITSINEKLYINI